MNPEGSVHNRTQSASTPSAPPPPRSLQQQKHKIPSLLKIPPNPPIGPL